jgi:hypothetical protein
MFFGATNWLLSPQAIQNAHLGRDTEVIQQLLTITCQGLATLADGALHLSTVFNAG